MTEKKWLVFYTKSRHELKVAKHLSRHGYEVFLPMQTVVRQWSDRRKKVQVPLFRSYLFVHDLESRISDIVNVPGVARNIRYNDRPAVLHERELDTIRRFLATGLFVETTTEPNFKAGEDAEVIEGPLKGIKGRIVHSSAGDKFSVTLEILGNSMLIRLDARVLARVGGWPKKG